MTGMPNGAFRIAERAEAAAWGPEQRTWFDRLHADHGNVRAALAWLLDRNDPRGLRLAAAMAAFWFVRGPIGEANGWMDHALAVLASDDISRFSGRASSMPRALWRTVNGMCRVPNRD